MYCKHRYWQKGYRTYGDDIPGYAQGAYFPGDEPGHMCQLSDEFCEEDPEPQDCCVQNETGWLCPDCLYESELHTPLTRNACGIVSCKHGHEFGECYKAPEMYEDEED